MGSIFSSEESEVVKKAAPVTAAIPVSATPSTVVAPAASAASSSDSKTADDGNFFSNMIDGKKTFRQLKKIDQGTARGRLHNTMKVTMKATLGGVGDMREAVKCPPSEDINEWLACNTVHFFNAASMVYGTCIDFCSDESCPIMSAGPKFEYLWMDGKNYKKPTKVSAPQYMDLLFGWIDEQLQDPAIFPMEENAAFPSNFKKVVANIFKRLFRLYGHIFFSHFEKCKEIGAEAHLNTCFKHLMYFINEHQLVDAAELEPMKRLIDKFMNEDTESKKK